MREVTSEERYLARVALSRLASDLQEGRFGVELPPDTVLQSVAAARRLEREFAETPCVTLGPVLGTNGAQSTAAVLTTFKLLEKGYYASRHPELIWYLRAPSREAVHIYLKSIGIEADAVESATHRYDVNVDLDAAGKATWLSFERPLVAKVSVAEEQAAKARRRAIRSWRRRENMHK